MASGAFSRRDGDRTRLALAAIVAAIAIDVRPILRLEPVWPEPPPIYGALAANKAVLAEFPFGGSHANYSGHTVHVLLGVALGDMVNGYSGHSPAGTGDFEVGVQQFPGWTNALAPARAGDDARDGQLRAVPRRLR